MLNKQSSKIQKHARAGVTLLLAIIVLSSILAISFSLATVLFIEIRTSGDLLRTEPAFYAASGLGEQALFKLKRSVCTISTQNCTFNYTTQFDNNVSFSGTPQQTSTTTPVFQDKVPANTVFTSNSDTGNIYSFYDPTNTNPGAGSGYGKVIVTNLNTGNPGGTTLYAYMCQYDPTFPVNTSGNANTYYTPPCSDPSTTTHGSSSSYWQLSGANNYPIGIGAQGIWYPDPTKQQELILVNGNNYPIYVQVETYGPDINTPKGLPLQGKTAIALNTNFGTVGRKIQVVVPNASMSNFGGTTDLAVGQSASESSTAFGGVASRAVDGNTDGNWADNSVSHTNSEANAWWQVDLGVLASINSVVVWNRTDCCSSRLGDYWVFVSPNPFNPSDTPTNLQSRPSTWSSHQTSAPNPSTALYPNTQGRYVRVQLSGTDYLSLAETQVWGTSTSTPSNGKALIAHSSASGTGVISSPAVNTTGATLIVAYVSDDFNDVSTSGTITDSAGNSWHHLTSSAGNGHASGGIFYAYDKAGSPLVTSNNYTLSYSGSFYASVTFGAFSGTQTGSDPADRQSVNSYYGHSCQPGSITPSQNNELIFAGDNNESNQSSFSVDSSMSQLDSILTYARGGQPFAQSSSYIIQTTAAAINPTWTNSPTDDDGICAVASFK